MAAPTLASHIRAVLGRRGATHLVAGTRAVRGALSTAASHDAPFCLANPPPADPEALRSRWREEALSLLATPSTSPDDDRSRWREQCLAIAGGAEAPAPPRDSHELGGYFS